MTDVFYGAGIVEYSDEVKPTKSTFVRVGEFMRAFDQMVLTTPQFPSGEVIQLRVDLIAEELQELVDAIRARDLVEVADALGDLKYVVDGAAHAFGIPLDHVFDEIHRSNMSKLPEDGVVLRRRDGKVLKPSTYSPPDLSPIIFG